jgi:hypothetical protein
MATRNEPASGPPPNPPNARDAIEGVAPRNQPLSPPSLSNSQASDGTRFLFLRSRVMSSEVRDEACNASPGPRYISPTSLKYRTAPG